MFVNMDTNSWEKFWKSWDAVIEKFPDAKHLALNEMGKAALKEVWKQIDQSGINDRYGRVKRWQSYRVGSGNGYVAVSPGDDVVRVKKKNPRAGEKTKAKDVTRYLKRGHKVAGPSGRNKRYRSRINEDRVFFGENNLLIVRGRQFYSFATLNTEKIAIQEAEKNVLVPLKNMLDGL